MDQQTHTKHDTPSAAHTDSPKVACDGGVGALGHPRVFLTFPPDGQLKCPYCGKNFARRLTQDSSQNQ